MLRLRSVMLTVVCSMSLLAGYMFAGKNQEDWTTVYEEIKPNPIFSKKRFKDGVKYPYGYSCYCIQWSRNDKLFGEQGSDFITCWSLDEQRDHLIINVPDYKSLDLK